MKKIKIDDLRIDGGTQGRSVIDQPTVYNYLEHMKEGDEFPRMFAVYDGATYWLVDGFHRYHAYKLLGIKEISIDYKPGTLEEAQVLSFGVNGTHGKPRTNEDKRNKIAIALTIPGYAEKSHYEIAKICELSQSFVAAFRDPEVKERQSKNRQKSAEKKVRDTSPTSIPETTSPTSKEPDPNSGATPDDDEIKAALMRFNLGYLAAALDRAGSWDRELADPERQALAFARLLLARPDFVVIDEAIDALSSEARAIVGDMFNRELKSSALI